ASQGAGQGGRRKERPEIEGHRAAADEPHDQEREAGREDPGVAEIAVLGQRVLDDEQGPEDDEEDADPGQAGPAILVAAPLPAIDDGPTDRPRRRRTAREPGSAGG